MLKTLDISHIYVQLKQTLAGTKSQPQQAASLLQYLETEITGYKHTIKTHTHQEVSPKNLPLFVHSQQYALTELLNYISDLLDTDLAAAKREILCKAQSMLRAALAFVQDFFHQYYNEDLPIPQMDWQPMRKELDDRITTIRKRLLSLSTTGLLTIATRPICESITDTAPCPSYRLINYFMQLTEQLSNIPSSGDINCNIRTILGFMGFNSTPFLQYLTDLIDEEVAALGTTEEKIDHLFLRAKQIKQIQMLPNQQLYPKQEAAGVYVVKYIDEEIAYWQNFAIREKTHAASFPAGQEDEKIHLDCPLSVLTAVLKVFVEAGHPLAQSQEQILRIAARTFTFRKKKTIPYGSIRTEYFSNSIKAKEAALEIFANLHQTAREILRK